MYKNNKIAIVVPAYNEEENILDTLNSMPNYVDNIIVIDDGSTDKTASLVEEFSKKDNRIRLVKHERNKGLGAALSTGYIECKKYNPDIVGNAAGDNQTPLEQIPRLIEPIINDETDCAKGNRFIDGSYKKMPLLRLIGNVLLSVIEKPVTGYWHIFDTHDGYMFFNKKTLETIDWTKTWTKYAFNIDHLARFNVAGLRVKDVPRRTIYLKDKKQSKIKIPSYVKMAVPLLIKTFFWRIKNKYFSKD